MWYSNLYKAGWVAMDENARVIDTSKLAELRLKEAKVKKSADGGKEGGEDGFKAGLDSETVDALLSEDGGATVLKNRALEEKKAIEQEIEEARNELGRVKAQTTQTMREAQIEIERLRTQALEEAKQQGYQEGYEQGMAETQALKEEYRAKKREMESDYRQRVEELEPQFVDNLTKIYEHIFKVDLNAYGELISHLVIDAMLRTDGARNYIIRVSRKDFPKISEQKGKIQEETGLSGDNLEIVSDVMLSDSQCMIETDGGIYDCSLGLELEELKRKLMLLAYKS